MPLFNLLSFEAKDQKSLDTWAFANSDDHQFVRDTAQAKGLGNLFVYELWPFNLSNWDSYALRHQSAHNEMNDLLGLAGTDLTGVDFNDPKAAAKWNLDHYREHQAWHAELGI